MQIIGVTENGFVLTASQDEVANLVGYHSRYSGGSAIQKLKPGNEIKIAGMFRHLYDLGSAKADIAATAAKLRVAADLIDTLPDPISAAEAKTDTGAEQ